MGNTPVRLLSLRGQRLEARVVTLFLALSLVTLTIVATVAYREARRSLGDAVYRQLAATSALKEGEINRWVTEQVEFIAFTAEVAALRTEALSPVKDPAAEENGYLARIATEARRAGVDFEEVFFLSAESGLVIGSTAPKRIGDDHASEAVFLEGRYVARAHSVDPASASGKTDADGRRTRERPGGGHVGDRGRPPRPSIGWTRSRRVTTAIVQPRRTWSRPPRTSYPQGASVDPSIRVTCEARASQRRSPVGPESGCTTTTEVLR